VTDRRYAALQCPVCGASPEPERDACPSCGRRLRSPTGDLDLLGDEMRGEADRFASEYRSLRLKEGWVGEDGREHPEAGDPRLWRGRLDAVRAAAARLRSVGPTPLLLDVGSGGGWAAGMLAGADVIAIDLLETKARSGLSVRGDMRRLPVRTGAVYGVLYAASLHYAPVDSAVAEAARVLRPGGLLVAVDSPLYSNHAEAHRAAGRSELYYGAAGFPRLARHYFPIDATALRRALLDAGLEIEQLRARSRLPRLLHPGPDSLVIATRLR
jgi:SAM-dependent methyltransferase